ncbi:MAG: hypothetical protein ABSG21_11025, partial [Spirochaetia bacterium]
MDEHTLALLEFSRVREELAGLCASSTAAALLDSQEFLSDRKALDELLALTLEFRAIVEGGSAVPGFDFPDIQQVIP